MKQPITETSVRDEYTADLIVYLAKLVAREGSGEFGSLYFDERVARLLMHPDAKLVVAEINRRIPRPVF